MKLKFFVLFCFISSAVFAVSSEDVNDDMVSLVAKINKITDDLNSKQQYESSLNQIIKDSNSAIKQSNAILNKLQKKRDLDLDQLDEIADIIPQINQATESAEGNVRFTITKIYQQLRELQSTSSGSIFNANNSLQNDRKKQYIIALLKAEVVKYQNLQAKIEELNVLNKKINDELNRLDKELGTTTEHKAVLIATQKSKLIEAQKVRSQINLEQKNLTSLKDQYTELNKLLKQLAATEQQASDEGHTLKTGKVDYSYEDNSPFLYRKLSKPVDGTVQVGFGELHGDVPNKGILFKATNSNIYSISVGEVLYVGTLPGFGQMVVVDHGDNYVSIYAGILPRVIKGQHLVSGQVIGDSGYKANQPMGGVYFELRHFGKPVNPSKLSG